MLFKLTFLRRACTATLLLLVLPHFATAIPAAISRLAAPLPQAMNFTVEGKITKVSAGKFTISTEANIIFHVSYNDKTEIKRGDGSKGSANDLRPGLRVKIEGDLTESGEVVAQKIEIGQDSAPEKRSLAREARPPLPSLHRAVRLMA